MLVLSAQDDPGIQWIIYRDRELNPCSNETPASRSTALTTVPNCRHHGTKLSTPRYQTADTYRGKQTTIFIYG